MRRNRVFVRQSCDKFQIEKNIYEEMISYCREQLPFEACGLISGERDNGKTLWKMENESRSPYRFSMSEQAVSDVLEKMSGQSEDLTGIFHSHPHTAAFPSDRDILFNPYPELAYFIVSFQGVLPKVGCFRMDGGQVTQLSLEIVNSERDNDYAG